MLSAATDPTADCRLHNCAYVPPAANNVSCVPLSTMTPSSSTRIRSARRIVDSRCEIISDVFPDISLPSAANTRSSDSASSDEEGSSRIKIGAFRMIARAMAISCRCPPDKVSPRSPMTVS